MGKPIGGRGNKGLGSTHIRVPMPLVDQVRALIAAFYQEDHKQLGNTLPSLDEARAAAAAIVAQKKSARQSVVKLLEVIYSEKIEL